MPVTIRQIGPCLAAEVEGIDMTKPLSAEEVAAIHAGMDRYAVLVFHDQQIDDAQQLAFTQSLGDIEHAIGTSLRAPESIACRPPSPTCRTSTSTNRPSPGTTGAGCSASAIDCGIPTARSR